MMSFFGSPPLRPRGCVPNYPNQLVAAVGVEGAPAEPSKPLLTASFVAGVALIAGAGYALLRSYDPELTWLRTGRGTAGMTREQYNASLEKMDREDNERNVAKVKAMRQRVELAIAARPPRMQFMRGNYPSESEQARRIRAMSVMNEFRERERREARTGIAEGPYSIPDGPSTRSYPPSMKRREAERQAFDEAPDTIAESRFARELAKTERDHSDTYWAYFDSRPNPHEYESEVREGWYGKGSRG